MEDETEIEERINSMKEKLRKLPIPEEFPQSEVEAKKNGNLRVDRFELHYEIKKLKKELVECQKRNKKARYQNPINITQKKEKTIKKEIRIGTLKIEKGDFKNCSDIVTKELACLGFVDIRFEWDEEGYYYYVEERWMAGYKIYAIHKDLVKEEIFSMSCYYNSEFNYIDFEYEYRGSKIINRVCDGLSDELTEIIPSETWEGLELSFGNEKRVRCRKCNIEILNPNLRKVSLCDRCYSNRKNELGEVIDYIDKNKYHEMHEEYNFLMSIKIC